MKKLIFLIAAISVTLMTALSGSAAQADTGGYVNHKEFNAVYFAERLSEWESWANVDQNHIKVQNSMSEAGQDAYIYYYFADFADMPAVYWAELHVVRGADGRLYIRPWKGIIKVDDTEIRYQMDPCGKCG